MEIKRIENNTARFITLPYTDTFPQGVRLIPGLNTVPDKYLAELEALESIPEPLPNGNPRPVRYPGREVLAQLQEPVRIVKSDGKSFGPQITIYADPLAGREDGPPAPADLSQYPVKAALKIIENTADKAALTRWKSDKRTEVKSAVLARLGA